MQGEERDQLACVSEVGCFGSLNIKDPTVTEMKELADTTDNPALRDFLNEHYGQKE